jgi:hypothetical protein
VKQLAIIVAVVCVACETDVLVDSGPEVLAPTIPGDVFDSLNDPAAAHAELCDHDATDTTFPDQADRITNRFCQDAKGGTVPAPHGLAELLAILGLDFKNPSGGNGTDGNPAFAILGHSSALTARKVSSITPTAFVFTPLDASGAVPKDYMFLAYDPGETFLEVASYSPSDMAVNFYLVLFDKDCTHAAGGCGPNDLLTPNQTTGWSNVRIYESTTALNNTIADCRQCHIGAGKDDPTNPSPLILRMQEIEAPFTHWFSSTTTGGKALLEDFHAAHGTTEDYGPIPAAMIDKADPAKMATFITTAGFGTQPNVFHSAAIEAEVMQSSPGQPAINIPMGQSSTWNGTYTAATSGRFIAAPYHDVKVTDPTKLAAMTQAYRDYLAGGTLDVDIRDVFWNTGLPDMGFAGPMSWDGNALLVQQCEQCHHSDLDPTISREHFLIDRLGELSREEKDLAITRLQMPVDTRLTMPPPLFRSITQAQRDLMIEALRN